MANIYDMVDVWNASGTTFTAIKMNATDTASASGSLLMDLQVGGVSRFNVNKDGSVSAGGSNAKLIFSYAGGTFSNTKWTTYIETLAVTRQVLGFGTSYLGLHSTQRISWSNGVNVHGEVGNIFDLELRRDAANTLAQRNSTNAQTFNLYNTFTDASNYERARFGWNANVFEIAPQAAGTGTTRVLHISGLPTANPGAGILWNNGGTVEVGT